MRCEEFEEVLSEYIEGDIEQERAEQVEIHLLNCPSCGATLRGVQQVRLVLRSLGRQRPPACFESALASSLQEETVTGSRQRWSRSRSLGVVLAVGLGILLWPASQQEILEYAAPDWNQTLVPVWTADSVDEQVYADDQGLAARPFPDFQMPVQVRSVSF